MIQKRILNSYPVIGITMGDPSAIGPEIIIKSFSDNRINKKKIVVIGDIDILEKARNMFGINSYRLNKIDSLNECYFSSDILNVFDPDLLRSSTVWPSASTADYGEAAYQYIKIAVGLIRKREINAIVTSPVIMESIRKAGHYYPGHTEILGSLSGTRDFATMLYTRKLSVILVSTHIPIVEAVTRLKQERIEKIIELADLHIRKIKGKKPEIGVAGLNPLAGEDGQCGTEEIRIIAPAVRNMKIKGFNVEGPLPPDTLFQHALKGKFDIVVAMYHDQGYIPVKLLGLGNVVNITAGLPFVRTSADHDMGNEISWKGIAKESSMKEAVSLAVKLAGDNKASQ